MDEYSFKVMIRDLYPQEGPLISFPSHSPEIHTSHIIHLQAYILIAFLMVFDRWATTISPVSSMIAPSAWSAGVEVSGGSRVNNESTTINRGSISINVSIIVSIHLLMETETRYHLHRRPQHYHHQNYHRHQAAAKIQATQKFNLYEEKKKEKRMGSMQGR